MDRRLILCALLGLTFVAGAVYGSVTSCHYCESTVHSNCIDPYNATEGQQVRCDQLDYTTQNATSRSVRPSIKNAYLKKVFGSEKKTGGPDLKSLDTSAATQYKCVKTELEYTDSIREVLRTCAPINPTLKSVCDFVRQEIETGVKVLSCSECDTEGCNAGVSLQHSFFAAILTFFLVNI